MLNSEHYFSVLKKYVLFKFNSYIEVNVLK